MKKKGAEVFLSEPERSRRNVPLTTLLFEWPIRKAPRLTLPLFILIAVLLHLSTIYLFNIVYAPPHENKPIAAQVFFLPPNSLASQQLHAWLQANDPAIFSPLRTVQANRPTFSAPILEQSNEPLPVLRSLPAQDEEKLMPLLPPTYEIVPPSSSFFPLNHSSVVQPTAAPVIKKTTSVHLLEQLATRTPAAGLGIPSLPAASTTALSPTLLKVNIDATGLPHHVIILQSSGNEIADEAATHWLMTTHFAPASESTWGDVLIFWGSS